MAENRSFFRRRRKRTLIVLGVVLVIALIVVFNLRSQREKTVKVTIDKVKDDRPDLDHLGLRRGQAEEERRDQRPRPRPDHQDRRRGGRHRQGGGLPPEARPDPVRGARRGKPGRHPVLQGPAHPGGGPAPEGQERLRPPAEALSTNSSSPRTSWKRPSSNTTSRSPRSGPSSPRSSNAEASLKSTLDNLNKTTFVSPIDGMITSLRVEEGEMAIIGTMNNPGHGPPDHRRPVRHGGRGRSGRDRRRRRPLGQSANVRVDAYPDTVFKGRVTEIGSSALQKATAHDTRNPRTSRSSSPWTTRPRS